MPKKVQGGYFARYAATELGDMDRDRQTREVTFYRRTRAYVLPPEEYERLMALDAKYGSGAAKAA